MGPALQGKGPRLAESPGRAGQHRLLQKCCSQSASGEQSPRAWKCIMNPAPCGHSLPAWLRLVPGTLPPWTSGGGSLCLPKGKGGMPGVSAGRALPGYQRCEDGGCMQDLLLRGLQCHSQVCQLDAGLVSSGLGTAGTPAQRLQLLPGSLHSTLEACHLHQEGVPEACRKPTILRVRERPRFHTETPTAGTEHHQSVPKEEPSYFTDVKAEA